MGTRDPPIFGMWEYHGPVVMSCFFRISCPQHPIPCDLLVPPSSGTVGHYLLCLDSLNVRGIIRPRLVFLRAFSFSILVRVELYSASLLRKLLLFSIVLFSVIFDAVVVVDV